MKKNTSYIIDLDRVIGYEIPKESTVETVNGVKMYYDRWVMYQKTGLERNKTLRTVFKLKQEKSFELETHLNMAEIKGYLKIDQDMVLGSGLVND